MNVVRLDKNEVPYSPPYQVVEAARKGLSDLNRYMDGGEQHTVCELLAAYTGVHSQHILLSPGSELLLREIVHIFSRKSQVVTVSPSFLPTVYTADRFAAKRLSIRLSPPDFKLDPVILLSEVDQFSLVVIDNPNNPTGQLLVSCDVLASIAKNHHVYIVIDEAYYEFSGITCVKLVEEHPNVCVVRTLDKAFGLAGMRIGYAVAGEQFIKALAIPFMFLPKPSLCAAAQALRDTSYMQKNVNKIIEERSYLQQALNLSNTRVFPTYANFLLVKSCILDIVEQLKARNIWVSDLSNQLPQGYFRVTVGTHEENKSFITQYANIVCS